MDDRSLGLWESWRRRRDAGAFEALVRPDLGRALGFARSLGCGPEDAEDAVQDALVLLAAERGEAPARVGPRAWFFRAVRDRARTASRSGWRRRRRERGAARREQSPAGTDGVAARDEVERALRALDEGDAAAVRLRFLQDLDYAEMAFVLGVNEGACRVRVHRALERLRASLGNAAPALVASLPLPLPHDAASMVHGALAASAGAGSAAATTTGGAVVMASATKTAAAAAVVLAAGAAGALIATTLGGGPGGGRGFPAGGGDAAALEAGGEGPLGDGRAAAGDRDLSPGGGGDLGDLHGLGVTAGEARFLRDALVAERARRDAAQFGIEDSGLEVLRRYEESGADPAPMLAGFDFVAGRIRTGEGPVARIEATGNPTRVDLGEIAKDAAVVEFGPGTFVLRDARDWGVIRARVEALEIRGAGIDRTTLVAGGSLVFLTDEAEVGHLRFRDLTWNGGRGGEQILDARGRVAATFERVRFVRWMSAGYGAPVGISGKAVLGFRDCEFLGDGGTRGGGHTALACRGTVLAVFQDCLFADVSTVIAGWSGAAARSRVAFQGCTFENATLGSLRYQAKPEFPVSATGCRIFYGPADLEDEARRRAWGVEYAADLSGTVFASGKVRCTLGDLAAALEGMRREDGEQVLQVSLAEISRSGPVAFDAWSRVRNADGKGWGPVRWRPLGSAVATGEAPSTPSLENPHGSRDVPGLDQVVRRSGLSSDLPARTLRYDTVSAPEGTIPIVVVEGGEAWPWAEATRLRADTGAPLEQ